MREGHPIPSDWTETDGYALVSFCIPSSRQWRGIIVGMVENLSYGRFWSRKTGIITDAQEFGREIFESMSICKLDEILEALQSIAASLQVQANSCGCSNGPGIVTDNGDVFFGNEPPLEEPTSFGQPGDEFATKAAYLAFKCKVANLIIGGIIDTLSSMSSLSLVALTAGATVFGVTIALGLFLLPPMAILIALIVSGIAFAVFHDISVALDARREELVCALYSAINAQGAYNALKDALEEETSTLGWTISQIGLLSDFIMQLAPINTMNKLFKLLELPAAFSGQVDCDVCGCTILWAFDDDAQGWIFTDISPPGQGSAVGVWDATGHLKVTLSIPDPFESAFGEWTLDTTSLGLTITEGDTITVQQSSSPDIMYNEVGGTVPAGRELTSAVGSGQGAIKHTFENAGALTELHWQCGNTTSAQGNFTNVRSAGSFVLVLQNSSPCPEV